SSDLSSCSTSFSQFILFAPPRPGGRAVVVWSGVPILPVGSRPHGRGPCPGRLGAMARRRGLRAAYTRPGHHVALAASPVAVRTCRIASAAPLGDDRRLGERAPAVSRALR